MRRQPRYAVSAFVRTSSNQACGKYAEISTAPLVGTAAAQPSGPSYSSKSVSSPSQNV